MQARLKTSLACHTRQLAWAFALAASAGTAQADVLVGAAPYVLAINGAQSDQGTGPLPALTFAPPANATLQEIVWWGYRLNEAPGGPYADEFTVMLGALTQSGTLSSAVEATVGGIDIVRYSLDIIDTALTATSISVVSDALDFEWYWQGINSAPDGDADFRPAFQLIGTVTTTGVPEPGSLALVALAGLMLLSATRRAR